MKYSIGRKSDNAIVLNYPEVSGTHCTVEDSGEGYLLIEDLDSTNHTYINGTPVKVARLYPADQLSIAGRAIPFAWLNAQLQELIRRDKTDYRVEFQQLRNDYERYQEQLKAIDWKYNKKNTILRITLSFVPLIAALLLGGISSTLRIILSSCTPALISIFLLLQNRNPKAQQEKEQLTIDFQLRYRCPKCGNEFGNRHWKLIEANKNCLRCKAQFA